MSFLIHSLILAHVLNWVEAIAINYFIITHIEVPERHLTKTLPMRILLALAGPLTWVAMFIILLVQGSGSALKAFLRGIRHIFNAFLQAMRSLPRVLKVPNHWTMTRFFHE